MSLYFLIPLISLLAVAFLMSLVFLWALKIKNNGIVDVFWAFNFLIIAAIIYYMSDGWQARKTLVCVLAAAWSFRLGTYLLIRVGSHLKVEEGRYEQLRLEWTTSKFFVFYQMQAISNVVLAIPFFIIALNKNSVWHWTEILGSTFWLMAIIGEGIADWQLHYFKKQTQNKGKVCNYGLWNYSRHPNYFFQLCIWMAVSILAITSPYGWISLICPISIGYLLFKVTGIPMTEEQAIRSKGEAYLQYQKTTSKFIPWFKKTSS